MKKIIGLFVAVLLLFSMPKFVAYASDLSDSIILQLTEAHTDNQIDINVNMITNTGILDMVLELDYDKSIFTFTGYEQKPGFALVSNFSELISTPLSSERTSPIRFSWLNKTQSNDFSTGNLLKLHFTLNQDVSAGEYKIGFRCDGNNSYVTYADNNVQSGLLKSAVISRAVVRVDEKKITKTQIVESAEENNKLPLILGIVLIGLALIIVSVVLTVLKIRKRKRKNKNWVKI
ncbi:MAG: hypothetical protein J6T74_07965 [Clostridia bacterium]|nr:hypothetical protein [Clostridia bacterium]